MTTQDARLDEEKLEKRGVKEKKESGEGRAGCAETSTIYSRLIAVVSGMAEKGNEATKDSKDRHEWKETTASARHRDTTAEGCSTHARMSDLRSHPHSPPIQLEYREPLAAPVNR